MGYKQNRASFASYLTHLPQAFLLKFRITHREHFVHQEDLRFQVCGDGEGEANVHAARIMLHGRVDEFFDLGESDDFIELSSNLTLAHTEDRPAQEGILAAGQFGMEAGADFEEATNASMNLHPSGGRFCDAGKNFQESGFAGAITADEAEDFSFADFEGDAFQGPESFIFGAAEDGQRRFQHAAKMITEERALLKSAAMVALAKTFAMDDDCAH